MLFRSVVDMMNQIFGGQLKRELVKLCNNPLTWNRSTSTGSQRISSDIGHGVDRTTRSTTPIIPSHSRKKAMFSLKEAFFPKKDDKADNLLTAATKAKEKKPLKGF